jgi:glycosyltransferase involved in cell wall biosynthesis
MKVDLVIPFYNENKNLKILCGELNKTIPLLKNKYHIIFIDDGSTDKSNEIIKDKIKNISYQLIINSYKSGQTICFKKAFQVIKGDYVIRMDSDLQDKPSDLKTFDSYLEHNYDVILGYRGKRKHNIILKTLTFFFDRIIKFLGYSNLSCSTGSFICFRGYYIKNLNLVDNDHRYLPIIVQSIGAKKNMIVQISHRKRKYGLSNYNTFIKSTLGIFEVIRLLLRINKNFYLKKIKF